MVNEIERLIREKSKAEAKGQWKEAASLSNYIGVELFKQGKYDAALQSHTEEMELSTMLGDKLGIAVAHRKIGECYSEMFNFKKALHHQKTFLDLAVTLESAVEEQRAWATLGRTYYLKYLHVCDTDGADQIKKRCLDKAQQSFITALDLAENIKSTVSDKEYAEMKARLLLNLGLVHEHHGNLVHCAESIRKAIFLTRKFDLHEDLHRCQYSLACVYQRCEQHNIALRLADEAIATAKILKDKVLLCEDLLTKATILVVLKDYESAKLHLKKAYRLHTPVAEDHEKVKKFLRVAAGLCTCQSKLLQLSETDNESRKCLFEQMADGLASIGNFRLSIEYYLSTLECLKAVDTPQSAIAAIYFSLAQTYADDNQYDKALEYFQMELKCNEGVPEEQVKTLFRMADIMCQTKKYEAAEKLLVNALSIGDNLKKDKLIFICLKRLGEFYEDQVDICKSEAVSKRLQEYKDNEPLSSDEDLDNDESQNVFDEIRLSELSECTDSEAERELSDQPRAKRRAKHPEAKKNELGETPLHRACISGNLKLVKQLIETGHPVNPRDNCGWLPLHEASNYGFYDIVEYLLEKGAWVNDRGGKLCEGITPLHDAAACGNTDVMKLLIAKGASVASLNNSGETPLDSLKKWWKRSEKDLDETTIEEFKAMELELKKLMKQVGQSGVPGQDDSYSERHASLFTSQSSSIRSTERPYEKRGRSPSSSPASEEPSEEFDYLNPHLDWEMDDKWDDPNQAEKEYQTVISNLRRNTTSEASNEKVPEKQQICALLDQDKMVRDWLVDDIEKRPQVSKRKRQKTGIWKTRKISDYTVPISPIQDVEVLRESNGLDICEDNSSAANKNSFASSSVDSNLSVSKPIPSDTQRTSEHVQSFCLRVHITDKVILIPVVDSSCTISWLSEEAAQRYHSLVSKKPRLLLMNKDGALLSGTDLVKTVLTNNEEVSTSVIAWDQHTLVEYYEQICSKQNMQPLSDLKRELENVEQTRGLCLSNAYIPSDHLRSLVTALQSYETLCRLDFSNTEIGDEHFTHLVHCFPKLASLVTLKLSCSCLTSASLHSFAELLEKSESASVLPKLTCLNLSYNYFGHNSSDAFTRILKLPSLLVIDLTCCDLAYFFFTAQLCNTLKMTNLQEFNVSKNALSKLGLEKLLTHLPKEKVCRLDFSHVPEVGIKIGETIFQHLSDSVFSSLSELILRGCFLADEDIKGFLPNISNVPALSVCDLSDNHKLSVSSLVDLVTSAHKSSVPLHNLYATGCCYWNSDTVTRFASVLKLKLLRNVCLNDIPQPLAQVLFDQWIECWGRFAICSNYLLCELKLQ